MSKHDEDYKALMEKYGDEAYKNAITAFSEGYLLGVKYARSLIGESNENKG